MKVIDLLNKIANGEEVPKKIKYKNKIYEWKEYEVCYEKTMTKKGWVKEQGYVTEINRTYFYLQHCYQKLNDEVEIIEEKKIPEKLNVISWDKCIHGVTHKEKELAIEIYKTQEKVNQVIDYLNSKGE